MPLHVLTLLAIITTRSLIRFLWKTLSFLEPVVPDLLQRFTGRAQLNPLVLEGSQPGGQLTTTSEVENFPGFPEGIDGFTMMDNLRKQVARFGARYEHAKIDKIEIDGEVKKLFAGDKVYEAKTVIVATGARPRLLGIPGEQEMFGGKGDNLCHL